MIRREQRILRCSHQDFLLLRNEGAVMFVTESGQKMPIHDCGCGNFQITYQQLDPVQAAKEIADYEAVLLNAGYVLHQENNIENNRFFTYVKGDNMIHGNYFAPMNEFRIIHGPKTTLGSPAPITDYERKVTPTISIIGMTDDVLCLVIQLPDGSYIIIDGGWSYSKDWTKILNKGLENEREIQYHRDVFVDMGNLLAFLKDNAPAGEKPRITWMITHADPDHITLPTRFIREYADEFELEMACYNFPNLFNVGLGESHGSTNNPVNFTAYAAGFINAVRVRFPEAGHYIYHTGQKLYLPGAEVEFLFSPEDYWPNPMPWMNHTSGMWRITIDGRTILIPGDAEAGLNNQLVKVFGDYLKSDIFQPNHHGCNCGTLELYEKVRPSVCFWACQQHHLDYDNRHRGIRPGYEFNAFLRQTAKLHFSNNETHTVLIPTLEEKC